MNLKSDSCSYCEEKIYVKKLNILLPLANQFQGLEKYKWNYIKSLVKNTLNWRIHFALFVEKRKEKKMATCKLGKKGCWSDGKCRATSKCENKIVTNADRIRAMSDEALAKFMADKPLCPKPMEECAFNCSKCWDDWLKRPAEEK